MRRNADHDSDAVCSWALYITYLWLYSQNSVSVRCKSHVCLYCCIRVHSESEEWRFAYLV